MAMAAACTATAGTGSAVAEGWLEWCGNLGGYAGM